MRVSAKDSRPVQERIKETLENNAVRIVDLFREWDLNNSGTVSKKEFRRAPALLGIKMPATEVDALFDAFDSDGLGILSFKELTKLLHHDVKLKQRSRRRQAQEEELQVVDIDAMRRIVKESLTLGELEGFIPVKKESDEDELASKVKKPKAAKEAEAEA